MPDYLLDQSIAKKNLKTFFTKEKAKLNSFGSRVNQTFEAHVFASTIKWYQRAGWQVAIENPLIDGKPAFRLKFSTRGRPSHYSYAICEKDGFKCQIRHQLRVNTKAYRSKNEKPANVCCDIVVTQDVEMGHFFTKDSLQNEDLISFGEVKHMSAFAELVAGFIGLVYELTPERLKAKRKKSWVRTDHISPFLNVSGLLNSTAKGLTETISKRKMDVDIYSFDDPL